MGRLGFSRSILVDAAVNLVPLGMLVAFLALFAVYDPWPAGVLSSLWGFALLVIPLVGLVVATAAVARMIQAGEEAAAD